MVGEVGQPTKQTKTKTKHIRTQEAALTFPNISNGHQKADTIELSCYLFFLLEL